ncbi:mitochondrial K+-H+ exchange-related-domain-containing protein [Rhizoctonia solani]|nr:mitochondrial K+-H+ exchange-related-domain-containing protein [Rhizoctonia solani]
MRLLSVHLSQLQFTHFAAMGKLTGSMKLFAFPLTASRDLSIRRSGHRHPLIYYYAQMPKRSTKSDEQPTLRKRAQEKISQTWRNWGKAPGGWKLKVHTYGEKMVDRIDFEELALASIDTSLGPKISQLGTHGSTGKELSEQQAKTHTVSIPLIYPPSFMSSVDPLVNLQEQLVLRSPLHRRKTWFWVGVIPLTAPFMLIPVIPNLPFFFCVWRAWTHWKAHKASSYLLELSNNDAIHASPSEDLDEVYTKSLGLLPDSSKGVNNEHNELKVGSNIVQLLPNPTSTISHIVDAYSLSKEAERSLLRAVDQAKIRSRFDEAKSES